MPFLELFDETLDINRTGEYILTLQAGYDDISFCIFDAIRNKYIMVRSYTPDENSRYNFEDVSSIIVGDDFLSRKYKNINLIMPSPEFTLVPSSLYEPARKDEYFEFNHGKKENRTILSNKIPEIDSFLLFGVSTPLFDTIRNFFPSPPPFHHMKPLFTCMTHAMKSHKGNYIHLHVENDFFNLTVFNGFSFSYLNAFAYRNVSDIVYFTLNVFKNLGMGNEETIFISGLSEKYDNLTSTLSLYVRNIVFAIPAGNFTFSYVFNEADLHRFINLYTAINCE
ncbi:MAG: DUF3822 family protein [Bacteroidales bacterium]|nr:DUF3822 family protein [Bacteroidales bacterium]